MLDNILMALDNLRSNLLRTALTMLGVTIGVAAVIILLSVGQSFETFVRQQFEGLGVNLVFVIPNFEADDFQPLTFADADALANPSNVPDATLIMPQDSFNENVRAGANEARASVTAVTPAYPALFGRELGAGRFFDESELETNARVAVLEQGIALQLFPDSLALGQAVRIRDVQFTVIGVMSVGSGLSFASDDGIYIPITTAQTRLNNNRVLSGEQAVDIILVQARSPDVSADVNAQIQLTLRDVRGVSFRDEDNFAIISQNEVLDLLDEVTGLLTVFLVILASISLIVGGIGIMNIMLVTVTERTREIGLRKAVGAQNSDILLQFLTEAVILSLIGGMIGVVLAFGATLLVTAVVPELDVQVQGSSVLLATAVSVAVGLLSGGYPANRAAQLNPIDALRYE
ncbi:MAG: ABC transporter permease [Chloroflexota bacterium]